MRVLLTREGTLRVKISAAHAPNTVRPIIDLRHVVVVVVIGIVVVGRLVLVLFCAV